MADSPASLAAELQALAARVAALPVPVVTPPPPPPPPPVPTGRPFSASANWNTKIAASPALSPRSADLVSRLVSLKPGTQTLQLNQREWSVNVAEVAEGANPPRVTARNPDGWTMGGVPMLAAAVGTPDSDAHLVIIDRPQRKIWNFQGNTKNTGTGYTAEAMGVFRLDGPGWWDPSQGGPWTGRSSNACLLGGLIRPEELKAGVIEHALAIGIDGSQMAPMSQVAAPATTSDGGGVSGAIPNGTRFQLDPNYDIASLPREARIIAKAMQDYGVFVTERTSGIALYFQSTANGNANYAGMNFSGLNGNLLSRMRVIAPAPSYTYDHPGVVGGQPFRS